MPELKNKHPSLLQMKKVGGDIAIDKTKQISYVSQQAWIMNATVRENIIFSLPYDQERLANFMLWFQYEYMGCIYPSSSCF